jgi:hypothetical protein
MQRYYQSIFVTLYRWNVKNFGHGSLPQVKTLFNVSFLLVIFLTDLLVLAELIIKKHLFNLNVNSGLLFLLATVSLLVMNHLIFMNNKWFDKLNNQLVKLGRHNQNIWSVIVLANVIIACFSLLFL